MVELLHGAVTREILGAYLDIRSRLPWGMHEKVYANAMCLAPRRRAVSHEREVPISVTYLDEVERKVIVEIKSVDRQTGTLEAQLINSLATTGIAVGLRLNFGLHGGRRRVVWTPSSRGMEIAGER